MAISTAALKLLLASQQVEILFRFQLATIWRPNQWWSALSLSLFQQEPRAIRQLISMLVRLRRSPLCAELSNQLRLHYRTLFCHQISEIFFFFLNTILVLKKKEKERPKLIRMSLSFHIFMRPNVWRRGAFTANLKLPIKIPPPPLLFCVQPE